MRTTLRHMMERRWAHEEQAYRTRILGSLDRDPSAQLLDVGCDDGAWTDEVRKRLAIPAAQVHGLEVVDERAALARERGFDVRSGDLDMTWPFADESFDVVHANQVIEHVARLDHFVTEVRRVLVRGGLAVVCTENLASWHNVGSLVLGFQPFSVTNVSAKRPIGNPFALHAGEVPEHGDSWQHVHVITLVALRDLFTVHGFAVTDSWGTGYYPFPRRLGAALAARDPRHAHFIAVVARRADRGVRRPQPDGS